MLDAASCRTSSGTGSRNNPSLSTQRIRESRKHLGISIGRKRLLSHCVSSSTDGDVPVSPDTSNDSRLLFRRGDDSSGSSSNAAASRNYFYETPPRYCAVSFLNDYVVLAVDDAGRIDAVRLPMSVGGTDGKAEKQERGTLLASRIGDPVNLSQMSHPCASIFPFRDGQAFAVGYPGGEIRVYATEHDMTWAANCSSAEAGAKPSVAGASSSNGQRPYLHCAVRRGGPRRKYERLDRGQFGGPSSDFPTPDVVGQSLREMLVSQSLGRQYLPEVLDWNEGQYPPCRVTNSTFAASPHLIKGIPRTEVLFDFREIGSGGSLLSAYVDPYLDCYSLRLIDGRTMSQDSTGTTKMTAGVFQRSQIRVDTNPLNVRGGQYGNEDITGLTFVGESALATSHVSFVGKDEITNVIKFWDIRMINSNNAKPATTAVVASFPFDDCRGVEALSEVVMSGADDFGGATTTLVVDPPDTDKIPSSGFAVSRLTGSVDNGRVSIATQSLRGDELSTCEHLEMNEFREVLVDTDRFSILHRTQKISSDSQRKPAFTPDLTFMAAYKGPNVDERNTSLLLYDLSNRSSLSDWTLHKKRSHEDMSEVSKKFDTDIAGKINGIVNDSYGTESELLCLALNGHGTALVGGSADGDLFLWG